MHFCVLSEWAFLSSSFAIVFRLSNADVLASDTICWKWLLWNMKIGCCQNCCLSIYAWDEESKEDSIGVSCRGANKDEWIMAYGKRTTWSGTKATNTAVLTAFLPSVEVMVCLWRESLCLPLDPQRKEFI